MCLRGVLFVKNAEISEIFDKIADLLEISGDNPFRIRAYRKAAFAINDLGRDVSALTKEELLKIPGIGRDLAGKIEEYTHTGKIASFENLKSEIPESLVTLLSIPGLGPKTVSMLYKKLKVKDIDDIKRLIRSQKLSTLPGIKEKTEKNIIKGIEMLRRYSSRHPIGKILPLAEEIQDYLSSHAPVSRLNIAGSLRRWKETIKDIDIIATSPRPEEVMKIFTNMPLVKDIVAKGPTKSSIVTKEGIQVDVRVVDEDSYGSALCYFTGSKAHNIRLRQLAVRSGLKLNEYGIFRERDDKRLGGRTEDEVYKILGLQYVPPELREDSGEVEAARRNVLPQLIELKDLKGDLHVHSNWSDGALEIEDLVSIAKGRGYKYLALTDHSKGLGVARGLNEERIMDQKKKIDSLNRKNRGFRLLAGIEINIKSDGTLDFEDNFLNQFDIVVASVHSGFKQSRKQVTDRIMTAMRNPHVSVIAHPTGRLIGERDAYEIDMEKIISTAAETGTALEINAYPLRLDLADVYVRHAKSRGVQIAISTDSHTEGQFDYMAYGIAVARRGWLEKKDVLNTLSYGSLMKKLNQKKSMSRR